MISLVNISLVLICIIHVVSILNTHLYPLYPDVHVYKANLKDIDFPLSFIVQCFIFQVLIGFQPVKNVGGLKTRKQVTQYYVGLIFLLVSLFIVLYFKF